jgi:hypothetical protein
MCADRDLDGDADLAVSDKDTLAMGDSRVGDKSIDADWEMVREMAKEPFVDEMAEDGDSVRPGADTDGDRDDGGVSLIESDADDVKVEAEKGFE